MQPPISSPQARGPFRQLSTRLILLFSSTARGTGRSCLSLQLQRESNSTALPRAPNMTKEIVDNYWPGEGIIAQGLPVSHTLVCLHSYNLYLCTYICCRVEKNEMTLWEKMLCSSLLLPGLDFIYLTLILGVSTKYYCCLQKLCFSPGEE